MRDFALHTVELCMVNLNGICRIPYIPKAMMISRETARPHRVPARTEVISAI